jgi:hypothetical protein
MAALVGIVALCVSLLPAFRVRSATLTLSRGTRGSPGRGVARWGRWLAAAQVALSVPLLVTAWIVATDLHRLERVSTGFQRLHVRPLQQAVDGTLLRERVMRLGAFYFAGLTTRLVFVGLYAVLNLGVVRRIPEIGLRIALGASTHDIRMMVIREALVIAAAGLVVGVPCAFVTGRLVASSLTLVGSHDALAFGAAIALILAVTMLSVLIPLRRASRVTPVEALGSQ